MRAAVGGDQDRGEVFAEAAADVADRGHAIAAVEMIIDEEAGHAATGRLDRLDGGVVIVSASDDSATIRRSLDFGASAFIPKRFGVETLRDAIVKVMDGDVWVPPDTDLTSAADPDMTRLRDRLVTLTPQQVRVLMMLSEGLLNKQIAYELGVSEATIKAHVSAILQKLGVESRTQAVIAAAKIEVGQWPQAAPLH